MLSAAGALCFRTNPLAPSGQKQISGRASRFSSKHPPTGSAYAPWPVPDLARFGTHWRQGVSTGEIIVILAGSRPDRGLLAVPDGDRIADGSRLDRGLDRIAAGSRPHGRLLGRGWISQIVADVGQTGLRGGCRLFVCVCLFAGILRSADLRPRMNVCLVASRYRSSMGGSSSTLGSGFSLSCFSVKIYKHTHVMCIFGPICPGRTHQPTKPPTNQPPKRAPSNHKEAQSHMFGILVCFGEFEALPGTNVDMNVEGGEPQSAYAFSRSPAPYI